MLNRLLQHLKPAQSEEKAWDDLTDEERQERIAEAKSERERFHREHVRNGPMKGFVYGATESAGKTRRRAVRDQAAARRKVNKRHRRNWMTEKGKLAVLRGHLVILGVIDCQHEGTSFTVHQEAQSASWVLQNYGTRDDNGRLVLHDRAYGEALERAKAVFLERSGVSA